MELDRCAETSGSESARRVRARAGSDRRRHRLRAGSPVAALDREIWLCFWRTENWDPVAGDFGALPFIWGTLYSSILALAIATPVALGIAIFISELCPARSAHAARVSHRAPCGDSVDCLRTVGHLRAGPARPVVRSLAARLACAQLPIFTGPPLGVGMLVGGADSRDHGDPVHLVGGARGAQIGADRAARRCLCARRDALRSDQRGALLRAHRHRRRRSCSASAARSARRWP